MALSLRDQLIQAGLASPSTGKHSNHHQTSKKKTNPSSDAVNHEQHLGANKVDAGNKRKTRSSNTHEAHVHVRSELKKNPVGVSGQSALDESVPRKMGLNDSGHTVGDIIEAVDLSINNDAQNASVIVKDRRKRNANQIKKWVEEKRLPKLSGSDYFHFTVNGVIKQVPVNERVREKLSEGNLVIVRHASGFEIIATELAHAIAQLDPKRIIFWKKTIENHEVEERASQSGLSSTTG